MNGCTPSGHSASVRPATAVKIPHCAPKTKLPAQALQVVRFPLRRRGGPDAPRLPLGMAFWLSALAVGLAAAARRWVPVTPCLCQRQQANARACGLWRRSSWPGSPGLAANCWIARHLGANRPVSCHSGVPRQWAKNPTSTRSMRQFRIKAMQFDARVIGGESPLGGSCATVAALRPSGHFLLDGLDIGATPVQALPVHRAELDFGHVQPTAVLGRVHELKLVQQPERLRRFERLVQRGASVGVEVCPSPGRWTTNSSKDYVSGHSRRAPGVNA